HALAVDGMPVGRAPLAVGARKRPWIHSAAGAAKSAIRAPITRSRVTKPGGSCRGRKTADSIWNMNVPRPKYARKTAATSLAPDSADRAISQESSAATSRQKRTGAATAMPVGGVAAPPSAAAPDTPETPAPRGSSRYSTAASARTRRPNLTGMRVPYALSRRRVLLAALPDLLPQARAHRDPRLLGALHGLLG